MDQNGFITDNYFFDRMAVFTDSYRRGELDVIEYSEFLLSPLKGKKLPELKESIKIFSADVVSRLTDDVTTKLLKRHTGDIKILTSGSLSFLVKDIASHFGIEDSFGTDPEYMGDLFTGKIAGVPNFSEEKVRRIKIWMESRQFENIYAYSDSIHDLPLLQFADISTAVNPDKKLRSEAEKRSWSIDDTRTSYS
jgi:HAD superfamily hydrolase (TIGR01490 family)